MEELYEYFHRLLIATDTRFKRYLYNKIKWDSRMFGIVGARGIGKTTLILQYIKEQLPKEKVLYVTVDHFYFAGHRLTQLADSFVKQGGSHLFIDEVHKYPDWSRELKLIYDEHKSLKIVFTGSSVLDILKGTADLSRRASVYQMQGLSFREYLQLFHQISAPILSLEDILNHQTLINNLEHPLPLFHQYLKNGYYPYSKEVDFAEKINQTVVQTLETDIPLYANMNVSTGRKLKQLMAIIAQSVPFKPNMSKIAEMVSVSRNVLADYFLYMEKASMITQLRTQKGGIRSIGKVEKIYLENTNLAYYLHSENINLGNVRETFFFNQMKLNYDVIASETADFTIDKYTFEIGGKAKKQKQIEGIKNAFTVKDDLEQGYLNTIPLWVFGLNY